MRGGRYLRHHVERDNEIERLSASGMRPRDIAAKLGITRNTVIGALNRAGMCRPKDGPLPPPPTFPELGPRACRWPLWPFGAKPTHEFCGAHAMHGRPYCAVHWRKAHLIAPQPGRA